MCDIPGESGFWSSLDVRICSYHSAMIELLRANQVAFVDRLAARVVASVPHYAQANADALRSNIDNLFGDLLVLLEQHEPAALRERFAEVAQGRIKQGL